MLDNIIINTVGNYMFRVVHSSITLLPFNKIDGEQFEYAVEYYEEVLKRVTYDTKGLHKRFELYKMYNIERLQEQQAAK